MAATPESLLEIVAGRIGDARVVEAIRAVPRERFVPSNRSGEAYVDAPLPIPHGQVTTQPSLVAAMLEALALVGDERVLEIGTGYGWQTALLARLAAKAPLAVPPSGRAGSARASVCNDRSIQSSANRDRGQVWSVERFADLAETAGANLAREGVGNAHVVVGDGSEGLPEHAPYAAIVVSAAFPTVPAPLAGQLAPGGRLVQPIGQGGAEDVVLFERVGERLVRKRSVIGAHFVRLVGRHAFEQ